MSLVLSDENVFLPSLSKENFLFHASVNYRNVTWYTEFMVLLTIGILG